MYVKIIRKTIMTVGRCWNYLRVDLAASTVWTLLAVSVYMYYCLVIAKKYIVKDIHCTILMSPSMIHPTHFAIFVQCKMSSIVFTSKKKCGGSNQNILSYYFTKAKRNIQFTCTSNSRYVNIDPHLAFKDQHTTLKEV